MINRSDSPKRSLRVFGLALVASLAVAGLLAGSASALSISPSVSSGIGGGGLVTISGGGSPTYTCESSELEWSGSGSEGTFAGEKLRGCKILIFGISTKCTTPGQPLAGTVAIAKRKASLVYLDAAKTKFGYKLTPESGNVAEFSCGPWSFVWTGSILGQITKPALGVETAEATLNFTSSGSSQTYQQVEGAGTVYHLWQSQNGGAPTELGITTNQALKSATRFKFLP
jgi:hypothetical protein